MKELTSIERKVSTAHWEKYHGGVDFENEEDIYFPEPPPSWDVAFAFGMAFGRKCEKQKQKNKRGKK